MPSNDKFMCLWKEYKYGVTFTNEAKGMSEEMDFNQAEGWEDGYSASKCHS